MKLLSPRARRDCEAYRGHLDTDDVLVIHVAGESIRRIRPITRRRTARSGPT